LNILGLSVSLAVEAIGNPADAAKDAEKDINAKHIQSYWSGSIAVFPVGVPIEFAKRYPRADAGVDCVTNDIPLREKQEKYARLYNEKIMTSSRKIRKSGKLKPK
jgi:hypothetical protein